MDRESKRKGKKKPPLLAVVFSFPSIPNTSAINTVFLEVFFFFLFPENLGGKNLRYPFH